jgi:hypothetical protein
MLARPDIVVRAHHCFLVDSHAGRYERCASRPVLRHSTVPAAFESIRIPTVQDSLAASIVLRSRSGARTTGS